MDRLGVRVMLFVPCAELRLPESLQKDAELWSKARAGDAAAREQLGELARAVAREVLQRNGIQGAGLSDLARDVARATFACLPLAVDPPRDLRAYLKFRTLGALAEHRRAMRSQLVLHDAGGSAGARESGPASARAPSPRELGTARRRLERELRTVLELRYEGELSCEKAAHALGLERGAVQVRVFRALAGLLARLRPERAGTSDAEPEGAA